MTLLAYIKLTGDKVACWVFDGLSKSWITITSEEFVTRWHQSP